MGKVALLKRIDKYIKNRVLLLKNMVKGGTLNKCFPF